MSPHEVVFSAGIADRIPLVEGIVEHEMIGQGSVAESDARSVRLLLLAQRYDEGIAVAERCYRRRERGKRSRSEAQTMTKE